MPVTIGGSGPITGVTSINTTVSDTELGYLDGVTSAIQSQLAGKSDTSGNGAWTAYTPNLLNITIGNGTLTAAYQKMGKLVAYRATLTLGSTTTIGSDAAINPPSSATGNYVGSAYYVDVSASQFYTGFTKGNYLGYQGVYGYVAATVPFTWAVNDVIYVSAVYQEA